MKERYNFNESESALKRSAKWLAEQGLDLVGATLIAGLSTALVNEGLNAIQPGLGYNFSDPGWSTMFVILAGSSLVELKRRKHE